MLISFSVENWLSFQSKVTFSMVASREKQHLDRVPHIPKYNMRLLPIAAIYGGNASGKTNFFKALNFARQFVVKGTQPEAIIPIEPFRLNPSCLKLPTFLSFELYINDCCYEFGFRVTRDRVVEEWLTEIQKTSEKELYRRKEGDIKFSTEFKKDQFLNFAFQGTRDNQLFLTNAVNQKVERFKHIYDWFKDSLVMIAPDSRFEPFERFFQEENPLYGHMNLTLSHLDTGISRLGGEKVEFDNLGLPENLKTRLREEIPEGATVRLLVEPTRERITIVRKNGELEARKLVSFHNDSSGNEIRFDMKQESDGTQRVIDLIPAFLELAPSSNEKVFVIDEIDRSLHTLLTRELLNGYLESCAPETRSQLLLTTHDVFLMDQRLFRRDEMWVTERDNEGRSSLLAFSDYKDVRYDKDIRKSYLQGKLGGIPRILISGALRSEDTDMERGNN
ncbi:MAG: ATP-binding protein [Deltaproteobacteria bacterium]|nr:ATP-binding protein [Deltaproteobacteria bacterium]